MEKREEKFFRGVIFTMHGGNGNKLKVFANDRMLKTNGLTESNKIFSFFIFYFFIFYYHGFSY